MKHLLKKHRMLSVGIFLAAVLSIIYAAILSPAGKSAAAAWAGSDSLHGKPLSLHGCAHLP